MNKLFAILAAATMIAVMTPAASAAESVTEAYTGALGVSATAVDPIAYLGLVLFPNSEESIFTQNGIRPFGGVNLQALGAYSNVVVGTNDDLFGSDAAISVCFWNPDGDNLCSPGGEYPDYPTTIACGPAALVGSPFVGSYVTVFVYSVHVGPDFDICGGSTGAATGDFF